MRSLCAPAGSKHAPFSCSGPSLRLLRRCQLFINMPPRSGVSSVLLQSGLVISFAAHERVRASTARARPQRMQQHPCSDTASQSRPLWWAGPSHLGLVPLD